MALQLSWNERQLERRVDGMMNRDKEMEVDVEDVIENTPEYESCTRSPGKGHLRVCQIQFSVCWRRC